MFWYRQGQSADIPGMLLIQEYCSSRGEKNGKQMFRVRRVEPPQ
jgi:hypothetical protein